MKNYKYNQQEKDMKAKIIKPSSIQHLPLQQLHHIVQHQRQFYKQITSKNLIAPRTAIKNQSKSLYYYNSINRSLRPNILSAINKTGLNISSKDVHHQTLNQELLGIEKAKPKTSHFNSGRNKQTDNNDLRNNKISLRSSSNYNRLSSVAGISLNQKQTQQRLEIHMNDKNNRRKDKQKQIQKENRRLGQRLESQQSQYSTKKLLKAYESQEKISKRLTDSKLSKRSNSFHDNRDNRSVCSQNSSRSSVKSGSSRNSQTGSMKSTNRFNSSKLSSHKKGFNRFQAKLQPAKNIKIEQHNINKMNQDELSKFKRMFANSFSTVKKERPVQKSATYQAGLSYQQILKNNPYVDIQVISIESEKSIKNKKAPIKERSHNYSFNNSIKKLKEMNADIQKSQQLDTVPKKSSVITQDGLLHRIAEEIYSNKERYTEEVGYKQQKSKKHSKAEIKSILSDKKPNQLPNKSSDKPKRNPIRAQFNYPLLPSRQVFLKF